MPTIKLSSKRQATFPRAVCEELDLRPGDTVDLEPRDIDGARVWVLRPHHRPGTRWFGSLRRYAQGKPHGMAAIRKSIGEAREDGTR